MVTKRHMEQYKIVNVMPSLLDVQTSLFYTPDFQLRKFKRVDCHLRVCQQFLFRTEALQEASSVLHQVSSWRYGQPFSTARC